MWSADGIATVPGDALCAEVEDRARPWLFASDRPDLSIDAWIARGGGDLLWGVLGPTRSQVLGVTVRLRGGTEATFGGRVVKNVAGFDLARAFCGARGALGTVLTAHLRLRPAPRGWRAARREGTEAAEALQGPGCAVWDGATTRFLRKGEPTPPGYAELDPLAARALLRPGWREVRSLRVPGAVSGILLATPLLVGSREEAQPERGPIWERLLRALSA